MDLQTTYVATNEREWANVWRGRPTVSGVIRELSRVAERPREVCTNASFFVAGALCEHGFHHFVNAGQPLLRRDRGDFIEEILFRSPSTGIRGVYVPVAIEIHVSHRRLGELRSHYWVGASQAPMGIASGNVGRLAEPTAWLLFNLADEPGRLDAMREIGRLASRYALPWMDLLRSPEELSERVLEEGVPLLDDSIALELLLCCRGPRAAMAFLDLRFSGDPLRAANFERLLPRLQYAHGGARIRAGDTAWNLAVIATRCGLVDPSRIARGFVA